MSYTGKPYTRRPDEVVANRIDAATKGPRNNLVAKLSMVEVYIRDQAAEHYGGNLRQVPCPDAEEWGRLSNGRRTVLPNEAQMAIYANDAMRRVASQVGSLRYAYFAVARHRLRNLK